MWTKSVSPFSFRSLAVGLATACLVAAPILANDTPAVRSAAQKSNVVLHEGGVLVGQVLNSKSRPAASQRILVRSQDKSVVSAKTDANGRFAFRGLRGGTYMIETASHRGVYQLWAPNTAPPSAQQAVVILEGQKTIVRGQGALDTYGPALRGAAAGALAGAGLFWALDHNDEGS